MLNEVKKLCKDDFRDIQRSYFISEAFKIQKVNNKNFEDCLVDAIMKTIIKNEIIDPIAREYTSNVVNFEIKEKKC